ncbi:helix-turn-helix domain-containing protein [Aeromonas veronii]|uniref:helix-turn-helix domain-containing protein n=1 Tax=Aeromonas veronii TaxID=654 RepID=UPI00244510F3|nr:helix-turn-helix transcriptional regulator [Aeromonas veronii]
MSNVVTLDQNSNTGSDVIARVKALLEQSTVTQAQIAKEIGVSGSTVNQLLNGNYKADPTAMVQKLANWLTARDQRADAPPRSRLCDDRHRQADHGRHGLCADHPEHRHHSRHIWRGKNNRPARVPAQ